MCRSADDSKNLHPGPWKMDGSFAIMRPASSRRHSWWNQSARSCCHTCRFQSRRKVRVLLSSCPVMSARDTAPTTSKPTLLTDSMLTFVKFW